MISCGRWTGLPPRRVVTGRDGPAIVTSAGSVRNTGAVPYAVPVDHVRRHVLASGCAALALTLTAACWGADAPPTTASPTPVAAPLTSPAPTVIPTPVRSPSPAPAPERTPRVTPSPAPAASPTPAAVPSPTPAPCRGAECFEAAPDAFEHKTWDAGIPIDTTGGIFFMDTETGRVTGYRSRGAWERASRDDRWVYAFEGGHQLLLDRWSSRSWRSMDPELRVVAASREHLLLDVPGDPDGRYVLVDDELREIARVPIAGEMPAYGGALFSPDGRTVALATKRSAAYLLDIGTGGARVVPEPRSGEEWETIRGTSVSPLREGRDILVTTSYYRPADGYWSEQRRFTWDGEELPWDQRWDDLSPDGLHAAWVEGGLWDADSGLWGYWPGVVVVADAGTGEPILRVRSATLAYGDWLGGSRWLASGDGVVMRVRGGYVIARVRPAPELLHFPAAPAGHYGYSGLAPLPAPGDDCLFSTGRLGVYDSCAGRWFLASDLHGAAGHHDPWGDSPREIRFILDHGAHGVGFPYFESSPWIEFPPFDDEVAFRVARTGRCLYVRAEARAEAAIRDCLPDGARVVLSPPGVARSWSPESSIIYWVYVRTESGVEGWVSHTYLERE